MVKKGDLLINKRTGRKATVLGVTRGSPAGLVKLDVEGKGIMVASKLQLNKFFKKQPNPKKYWK